MDLLVAPPKALAVVTLPTGSTFGPRRMTDWEILWILEGEGEFHSDGRIWPIAEGSLILCVPGITDYFVWDKTRPTRSAYVHFDVLQSPPEWPAWKDWPPVRPAREGDAFTFGFRHLLSLEGRDARAAQLTVSLMLAAWLDEDGGPRDVPPLRLPPPVESALAWLNQALEQDARQTIRLSHLAGAACVTPGYLCRLFKAHLGHTPAQVVTLSRLDLALPIVARSDVPLERIAEQGGFAGASHFSRAFRAAFGMSPRQCRQRVQKGHLGPEPLLLRRVPTIPI